MFGESTRWQIEQVYTLLSFVASSSSVVGANSLSSKGLGQLMGNKKPSVTISKDTIFVSEAAEDCWRLL